jgi:hypothetical protein
VAGLTGDPVYTVRGAPGGIDINATLGKHEYSFEQEVAFPNKIDACHIAGCTMPDGTWIPNPNFGGGR